MSIESLKVLAGVGVITTIAIWVSRGKPYRLSLTAPDLQTGTYGQPSGESWAAAILQPITSIPTP